ncbi:MAG: 50S ribosomal protein L21 [Flavobacteriales bacterium]|nr:50S ribosomal protein L21 [Flavobacteriales bacterium]
MYAIVEIAGHQYKVQKDQRIFVNRLQDDEGTKVQFDDVLLIDDGGKVTVGAPAIEGAAVKAKIERHLKGDKVIVFKKKRRKGYKKKKGFRAYLTELQIEGIMSSGAKKAKKAAPKKEEKVEAKEEAPKAKAEAPKKEAPKKETPKAEAPKKEAAPKKESKPKAAKADKGDDLRKVEGIGPKIAEVFNNAGISTFAELAATDIERCKEILAEAGSRYKSKDPTTWPKQAGLAAEGKWDELKEWQDNMKGGKEA